MKKLTALLLVLVMTLALCACGAKAPARLEIKCVDDSGEPVPGVTFKICQGDSCQIADADETGYYAFEINADADHAEVSIHRLPEGYAKTDEEGITLGPDSLSGVIKVHRISPEEIEVPAVTEEPAVQTDEGPLSKVVVDTLTSEGEIADNSVFSGHRVTMINMWEPWCPPCKNEMPDLEKLYEKYEPEGFQIIGVYSTEEGAKDVLGSLGVTYPNLVMWDSLMEFSLGYVPNTVFVDSEGNVLTKEVSEKEIASFGEEARDVLAVSFVGGKSYEDWESIILGYLSRTDVK